MAAPNLEGVTTQSLANPVVQPSDAQLLEQTTIASLRSTQHLDINGNPISKSRNFCAQLNGCLQLSSRSGSFQPYPAAFGATARHHQIVRESYRCWLQEEKLYDARWYVSTPNINSLLSHNTNINPQNHTINLNNTKAGVTAPMVSILHSH